MSQMSPVEWMAAGLIFLCVIVLAKVLRDAEKDRDAKSVSEELNQLLDWREW